MKMAQSITLNCGGTVCGSKKNCFWTKNKIVKIKEEDARTHAALGEIDVN